MELAPAWMSYKESSTSQGSRFLGKERERGVPKYGRQLSFSHVPTYHSSSHDPDRTSSVPFACSLSSPPAPPHTPASILGEQPRVLNRSKSSPGFGSPKSKQKKSPDRAFSSFSKPPKPKPPKPPLSPSSYMKSHSQPNLLNNEKANNWHQAHKAQHPSLSPSPSLLSPSSSSVSLSLQSNSATPGSPSVPSVPPSTSPPLPPSSSPPPVLVPEIDKLKTLIPATGPPPKSVRPRVMVGPPLPLAKKAPPSIPNNNSNINNLNSINTLTNNNTGNSNNNTANINTINNTNNSNSNNSNNSNSTTTSNVTTTSGPNNLAAYFRKATSEPSLMHHKTLDAVRRATAKKAVEKEKEKEKERAKEKEKATFLKEQATSLKEQLLQEAVDSKQPKRSNFFQHLIRQEEQGVPITEDESPIGMEPESTSPLLHSSSSSISSPSISSSSSLPSPSLSLSLSSPPRSPPPPSGIKSPLPEDSEDEERFLRTLGWVPDEEDPVPVLEEDEIRDVRVKIFLSRGAKTQEEGEQSTGEKVEIGVDVK